MTRNSLLLVALAPLLLIAACLSNGPSAPPEPISSAASLCGSEYVSYQATRVLDINFLEKTVTPFSPSDESCKALVLSQYKTPTPTQPLLTLLSEEGLYTFEDLGYQDIVLHSWDTTVLRHQGNVVRRHTRTRVEYQLPDAAAQGPEVWYIFHFHFEIEFTDDVDSGRVQVTAYANGYTPEANSSFGVLRQDGSLIIESSRVLRAEQDGNKVEAWSTKFFSIRGIQPGHNTLSFAVNERDGAVAQTFRVFSDSAIEVTTVSPLEAAGIHQPD